MQRILIIKIGCSVYKNRDIYPAADGRKEEGIEAVEETSMTRHNVPAVFYRRHSFQFALKKVTIGTGYGGYCGNEKSMDKGQTSEITNQRHNNHAQQGASCCSFPGFFW